MKNGTTNGTHHNGHGALDPVAHARAHAAGQIALADDAALQFERASKDRAEAERAFDEAEAAQNHALNRSIEDPGDGYLDDLTRATTLCVRARSMLDAAKAEYSAAEARAAEARGRALDAANAAEARALEDEVLDPARRERFKGMGQRVVGSLAALHELFVQVGRELAAEHAQVTRARQLGSDLEYGDGLPFAQGFAEALLSRGVDLGPTDVHPIRWLADLAPRTRLASPAARTVNDAVGLVVGALSRQPHANGAAILRQAVATWDGHRSYAAARDAEAARLPAPREPPPPLPPPGPEYGWNNTAQDLVEPGPTTPELESVRAAARSRRQGAAVPPASAQPAPTSLRSDDAKGIEWEGEA